MTKYFKSLMFSIAALSILLTFTGCSTGQSSDESSPAATSSAPVLEKISPEKAKEMMDTATPIILDVRTQEEYDESHIEGAILIPDYEISEKAVELLTDKDAVILVYCRSGRRSALAAKALSELGYSQIYDFGGIIDWPYDVVAGQQ